MATQGSMDCVHNDGVLGCSCVCAYVWVQLCMFVCVFMCKHVCVRVNRCV